MNKISFRDIDVSRDGWIRCDVVREEPEEFYIQLPYSFEPAPDLIAAAFAAMCGRAFSHIHIDLPLGDNTSKSLSSMTQASLTHLPGHDIRRSKGVNQALNFSGGFDSIAAKTMIPQAYLVSLDFGGRFSRERKFFDRFGPLTFETNLVPLKLNRYSWQFMGIGSILLRDELQLGSYSFGSILAGSMPRLIAAPHDQSGSGIPSAAALGMSQMNPVAGISEIGAIYIVAQDHPELIPQILQSVANPGEDKYLRKYQMVEAVCTRLGFSLRMPEMPPAHKNSFWGASFPTDLASLYVIKQLGVEYVNLSYQARIPEEIVSGLESIDLSFMLKFNPHAYAGILANTLSGWYSKFIERGLGVYDRQDWVNADKVIQLLSS